MKKIKLALFACLSAFLFSCSSEDGPTTSGQLTGKWYHKEAVVHGHTYPYDGHESCGKDYIQFNADGTGAYVDIYQCDAYFDPFVYTRSGNTITLTSGTNLYPGTVVELSDTTLRVKTLYDYDDNGTEDTVVHVYTRS